jgi:hypothetical protein
MHRCQRCRPWPYCKVTRFCFQHTSVIPMGNSIISAQDFFFALQRITCGVFSRCNTQPPIPLPEFPLRATQRLGLRIRTAHIYVSSSGPERGLEKLACIFCVFIQNLVSLQFTIYCLRTTSIGTHGLRAHKATCYSRVYSTLDIPGIFVSLKHVSWMIIIRSAWHIYPRVRANKLWESF